GKKRDRFKAHQDFVTSVTFSPDGRRFLSGSHDGTMRFWDVATRKVIRILDTDKAGNEISCVAFSPDGKKCLSTCNEEVRLWCVETGKELNRFRKHTHYVESAVFSPDGHQVLSGDLDGIIRLWEVEGGKELRHFEARLYTTDPEVLAKNNKYATCTSVAFSRDGHRILSGHGDNTVR